MMIMMIMTFNILQNAEVDNDVKEEDVMTNMKTIQKMVALVEELDD